MAHVFSSVLAPNIIPSETVGTPFFRSWTPVGGEQRVAAWVTLFPTKWWAKGRNKVGVSTNKVVRDGFLKRQRFSPTRYRGTPRPSRPAPTNSPKSEKKKSVAAKKRSLLLSEKEGGHLFFGYRYLEPEMSLVLVGKGSFWGIDLQVYVHMCNIALLITVGRKLWRVEVLLQMGITPLTFDGYAIKSVKLSSSQQRSCSIPELIQPTCWNSIIIMSRFYDDSHDDVDDGFKDDKVHRRNSIWFSDMKDPNWSIFPNESLSDTSLQPRWGLYCRVLPCMFSSVLAVCLSLWRGSCRCGIVEELWYIVMTFGWSLFVCVACWLFFFVGGPSTKRSHIPYQPALESMIFLFQFGGIC